MTMGPMKFLRDYIPSYQEYGGFDVKIIAQNKTFFAHRLILSAGSSFLKSILLSVEKDDEPIVLILSDFSFEEVAELLHLLYNGLDFKQPPKQQLSEQLELSEQLPEQQEQETQQLPEQLSEEQQQLSDEQGQLKQQDNLPEQQKKLPEQQWEMPEEQQQLPEIFHKLGFSLTKKKRRDSSQGETSDNDDISRPAKKSRWGENRYHCDECMFKTCRPGRLQSHMESKHPLISQRIWEEDLHEEQEEEEDLEGIVNVEPDVSFFYGTDIENGETNEESFLEEDNYPMMKTEKSVRKKKYKDENNYECDVCDFKTCRPGRLKLHMETKHSGSADNRTKDDDKAKKGSLQREDQHPFVKTDKIVRKKKYTDEKNYECDECDFKACRPGRLKLHMETKHPGSADLSFVYDTDHNNSEIKQESFLRGVGSDPSELRPDEMKYKCDQCEFLTYRPGRLKEHVEIKHLNIDRWHHCPFENCDKKYRMKQALVSHKYNSHRGNQFYCDKCSYKSKLKADLKLHIMKHHDGVKFICEQCGHEAANPQSLRFHRKIVHEGATFPCAQCDFVGATYGKMMHHVRRTHTSRTFMCETCSSAFYDKGALNKHVKRVHGDGGDRLQAAATSLKRNRQTEQIVLVEAERHLQQEAEPNLQAQQQIKLNNRSQDLIVFIKKID